FCSCASRVLLSLPTRRSSDLSPAGFTRRNFNNGLGAAPQTVSWCSMDRAMVLISHLDDIPGDRAGGFDRIKYRPKFFDIFFEQRSEEHTSELQSRENLVCRLL